MPHGLKKKKIMDKKACLCCLKIGHFAKNCKALVRCMLYQKRHLTIICPDLEGSCKTGDEPISGKAEKTAVVHSQLNCTSGVLLQTLRCVIRNGDKRKKVRVLLDTGSQRSYLLDSTAVQLGLQPRGETKLCRLLFGEAQEVQLHKLYEAEIERNGYHSQLKLLGHQRLCDGISKMAKGPWMAELKETKFFVNDLGEDRGEVEVLVGSEYYAHWLTDKKCSL